LSSFSAADRVNQPKLEFKNKLGLNIWELSRSECIVLATSTLPDHSIYLVPIMWKFQGCSAVWDLSFAALDRILGEKTQYILVKISGVQ
jgi:hypothetical protein